MKFPGMVVKVVAAIGIGATLTIAACSDNPSTSDQASVTMRAEMTQSSVMPKTALGAAGAEVDSLKVTRVRLFVRRLKLHRDKEDTVAGDKEIKTEPFVISIEPSQSVQFVSATVPPGAYDHVKFEFHKPEASQVAGYLADTTLRDFVTGDRYSSLIDVILYKGNQQIPYTFKGDATANLSLKFPQAITLNTGAANVVVLSFDPAALFKKGGTVLDPRDGSNENDIENALKDAIKALKR